MNWRKAIGTRHKAQGILLLEAAAALALTGVLLAVVAGLVVSYNRTGDYFMSHHQAQLAAESYVECLRAGLAEPPRIDRVQYEVQRQPGQGAWSGLTRITVTATVQTHHNRVACYRLTTYMQEQGP